MLSEENSHIFPHYLEADFPIKQPHYFQIKNQLDNY
jgi:hypothetical protein